MDYCLDPDLSDSFVALYIYTVYTDLQDSN